MLRTIFVILALLIGWGYAFQSALYAACLYLWIAYFRPEMWAWDNVFQTLNLSYFAGIFLIIRTVIAGTRPRIDLRSGLLIAFLAQALVSSLLGPNSAYSMSYWYEFAKTIIVSYLLTILIQTPSDLRLILTVIVLSLGFEAGKQGWAQLVLNPGARNDNNIPFLGDNNLVAVGMAMLLPMVGALGQASKGWQRRGFQFLSIGVLYRGLSTYSRGGMLAIGAVGALYLWRSPHKMRTIVAFAVALAIVVPVLPAEYWDRMSTISAPGEGDSSQASRLHFWEVAVQMANDRPLTGVGHSGFPPAYESYDTTAGRYGTMRAVHSAWFGVLAELGYPGFAMFLAIVLLSLIACRQVRRMAKRGEVSEMLGRYAIGLEASLIAFMVGGSFVSFHYCEMLWHFFALATVLKRVAVSEAAAEAARRSSATAAPIAPTTPRDQEPEFAWG